MTTCNGTEAVIKHSTKKSQASRKAILKNHDAMDVLARKASEAGVETPEEVEEIAKELGVLPMQRIGPRGRGQIMRWSCPDDGFLTLYRMSFVEDENAAKARRAGKRKIYYYREVCEYHIALTEFFSI